MKSRDQSLEEQASWLSFLFLAHLDPIFKVGSVKPLELTDLGVPSHQNRADVAYFRFSKYLEEERSLCKEKRSMWNVVWKTVGYFRFFYALMLFALSCALTLGPVMILDRLVQEFQGSSSFSKTQLWILVALLFVFPILCSLAMSHSTVIMVTMGVQVRNALIGAIYRKTMTVSPSQRLKIGTGKIISLFSDDTNNVKILFSGIHNVVMAPFQLGALLYLIYQQVGVAVFVGLGYSFVSVPIAGIVMSVLFSMYDKKKKESDLRVKLMNEVLNGIRIIKYYAWEDAFIEKIGKVRKVEMAYTAKMGYLFNTIFSFLLFGGPQFQTILIFLTYIGLGNTLDAARAFTTLTLFGIMTTPLLFLSFGMQQISVATVSLNRIADYLDAEDLGCYVQNLADNSLDSSVILAFSNATLGWASDDLPESGASPGSSNPKETTIQKQENSEYKAVSQTHDDEKPQNLEKETQQDAEKTLRAKKTLLNIDLSVNQGSLVAIVGSVGCGKSSMLQALMGEMILREGNVMMKANQSLAFCDQRPWIVNATVRENIVFGQEYDNDRMQQALQVSALQDDLRLFAAGIDTEIGERGVTLSGGQKARVALARAVYANADIYLLDDPLSAVDAHVGEHIFQHCIRGFLCQKTVLLVTNQLHVLPLCDQMVILNDQGQILVSGTYADVTQSGVDVKRFIHSSVSSESEAVTATPPTGLSQNNDRGGNQDLDQLDLGSATARDSYAPSTAQKVVETKKDVVKEDAAGKLMSEEERNDGDVPWNVYMTYFIYGGITWFFWAVFSEFASQALQIAGNFWLSSWGEETSKLELEKGVEMTEGRSFWWFRGYSGFLMASVTMMSASRVLLTQHRLNAAIKFHDQMLRRVFFLSMSFFDVTPVGRILNRFSQDVATVDEELAQTMSQMISLFGAVFGSIGAIAAASKGTFLILLIPLSVLYSRWNNHFRKSNTGLARLEAVSRSPIFADFSQTLAGTSTIHAYQQQGRFIHKLEEFVNANSVPNLLQLIAVQWLSLRLDLLGSLVMFFMGALAVSADRVNFIPAGFLGLGLSYSIQMTGLLKYAVTILCALEAQFNAVQRVRQYGAELETEEPLKDNEHQPPATKHTLPAPVAATTMDKSEPVSPGDIEMQLMENKEKNSILPPLDWPNAGKVQFLDVKLRYRDGPLVLKGISFDAEGGDKIGIAGRTGYALCLVPFIFISLLFLLLNVLFASCQ